MGEARETTFGPEQLLQQYKDGVVGHRKEGRKEVTSLLVPSQQYSGLSRCAQLSYEDTEACLCVLESCIHWYPCSLKYCRNSGGEGGEHRCGIRTCSKCTEMRFTAKSKVYCS